MVDALNRLDQTDALVEQVLRSTVVTRNQTVMRRRIRWKLKLPRQPNQTTTIIKKHRRTRRVISWIGIPKELMMTFIPWWTNPGPLWYPDHGKDLWMRMKQVR